MTITFKYFGQIAELLQKADEKLELEGPVLVSELKKMKETEYPALAKTDYRIAVNQVLADTSLEIKTTSEIAFLPPFAGG
ncbi:MAG: MoaD/ThiS family protein [Bacteroidetes bacterium]|nr:MoaD/ThiS family protein [Bacteroidota bacterium]